jgi:hypothetical protein
MAGDDQNESAAADGDDYWSDESFENYCSRAPLILVGG